MKPEPGERDRQEAREIRDRLVARSQRHENEQHAGEVCVGDRISLIAFLAHSLGLQPVHMDLVAGELIDYREQHLSIVDHNGHDHGGNAGHDH